MSKGLRLSFYGITCTIHEIKVMSHTLGYGNDNPVWDGWSKHGGYRNFFGINPTYTSDNPDDIACKSLVEKGLMYVESSQISNELVFHVTMKGKRWFSHFRRNHPHADLGNKRIKKTPMGA